MRNQLLAFLSMLSLAGSATPALAQHVIKASPKLWVEKATTVKSQKADAEQKAGRAGANQKPDGSGSESTRSDRAVKSPKANAESATAPRERANKASPKLF